MTKNQNVLKSILQLLSGWSLQKHKVWDGAVVRALASHQCGPGSIPGLGVICGLSLLVLVLAPIGYSPGTPVFPSPQKQTLLNSNSNWKVSPMGPLQLAVTWYKIHHAGEQATHWDIQNKENANLS